MRLRRPKVADTGHGTFDGGRFDGELIGDSLVDEPFGDECADFTLARGECVESFAHFLLALAAGGMRNASFKHLSGDSWGEYCVTVGDGVNRVDEVVLGDVLEQEAAGSGVETAKGVIVPSSYVVRMRMLMVGQRLVMRRVASMPSIPGIRTSMRITFGNGRC